MAKVPPQHRLPPDQRADYNPYRPPSANRAAPPQEFLDAAEKNRPPVVFVVNTPVQWNNKLGKLVPRIDMSSAFEFGELIQLTKAGAPPVDHSLVLPRMAEILEHYRPDDFLLLTGPPSYMAWAAVLAAHNTGGRLKLLVWHNADDKRRNQGEYRVVDINLYKQPPEILFNDFLRPHEMLAERTLYRPPPPRRR